MDKDKSETRVDCGRKQILFALLLQVVGLALGALFAVASYNAAHTRSQLEVDETAVIVSSSIYSELNQTSLALDVLKVIFNNPLGEPDLDMGSFVNTLQRYESSRTITYHSVVNGDRDAYENETTAYWNKLLNNTEDYPIRDLVGGGKVVTSKDADFYMCVRYVHPIPTYAGTERWINLNTFSITDEALTRRAMENQLDYAFDPFFLPTVDDPYRKVLFYIRPINSTSMVMAQFRIIELIQNAVGPLPKMKEIHLFIDDLNAGSFDPKTLENRPPINFKDIDLSSPHNISEISTLGRSWKIVLVAAQDTSILGDSFGALNAIMLPILCFGLALLYIFMSIKESRWQKEQLLMSKKQLEDEALFIAQSERKLNEMLSNEIRNPLCAAIMANELCNQAINESEVENISEIFSINHDMKLVSSSLTFVKNVLNSTFKVDNEQGRFTNLQKKPLSIRNDVLLPVKTMLDKFFGTLEMQVETGETKIDTMMVQGDSLRLQQIFLNLAKNSSKFVEKGYIKMTANWDGDQVLFTVEDSGPGISVERQKNLFEKYKASSEDVLRSGTGVGLSLCKSLVESMGGTIAVDPSYVSSIPGCPGTRMEIRLPLEKCEEDFDRNDGDDAVKSPPVEFELGKTVHVLHIDGDATIRSLVSRLLKTTICGVQVHHLDSGQKIQETQNLVSLLDIVLVDYAAMSAVEFSKFVRYFRESGFTKKIIATSTNSHLLDELLELGVDDVLTKPFTSKSLKDACTK